MSIENILKQNLKQDERQSYQGCQTWTGLPEGPDNALWTLFGCVAGFLVKYLSAKYPWLRQRLRNCFPETSQRGESMEMH